MCIRDRCLCGRAGVDAQLVAQRGGAGVIDAQRAGAVVQAQVKLHQLPIRSLVQRVGALQLLSLAQRVAPAARLVQQARQLLQRIEVEVAQPLGFGYDPLVVPPRGQVARCLLYTSRCV